MSSKPATRIAIYIDGANFYHGLQGFNPRYQDFDFDFVEFGTLLAKGREITGTNYYIAPYPRSKSEAMYQKQIGLFQRMKKDHICVKKARISPESNRIKGDDIQLAVDMLDDAARDKFDLGILVSSDGDFTPLVRKIHTWGKKVEVLYFKGHVAKDLLDAADFNRAISRTMARKCYIHKFKSSKTP